MPRVPLALATLYPPPPVPKAPQPTPAASSSSLHQTGLKWFRNKYLMRVICATLGFRWCPPGEELLEAQERATVNYHLAGEPHSIMRMKAIFTHLGWSYPEQILNEALGVCKLN